MIKVDGLLDQGGFPVFIRPSPAPSWIRFHRRCWRSGFQAACFRAECSLPPVPGHLDFIRGTLTQLPPEAGIAAETKKMVSARRIFRGIRQFSGRRRISFHKLCCNYSAVKKSELRHMELIPHALEVRSTSRPETGRPVQIRGFPSHI